MNIVLEQTYNIVECVLVAGFLYFYFGIKKEYDSKLIFILSAIIIFLFLNLLNISSFSWIATFISYTALISSICRLFYNGKNAEQLIIAIILNLLLALTSACSLIFIGKIHDTSYISLLEEGSHYRFISVVSAKLIFLCFESIIIGIKKKFIFMLSKTEYLLISITFIISFILIVIVRNRVYNSVTDYELFLSVLICLLLINIVQSFLIIYISRKNVTERNMSLMKKQIQMQQESLCSLEEKYDETSRLRHDMKNYISCAIGMAEQAENIELSNYLKTLIDEKITPASRFIITERNVLDAVLNAKMTECAKKGIIINCAIMDKMSKIDDTDIGILFANLLDNAIEACEKNEGESEILLKTWNNAGYYCIEVINTVEIDVLLHNPRLLTSKNDKQMHGFGLRSVNKIVEKYNGIINFYQRSNKFYVYISLARV